MPMDCSQLSQSSSPFYSFTHLSIHNNFLYIDTSLLTTKPEDGELDSIRIQRI